MTSALTAAGLNVNTAMMDWYSAQIAQMKEDKTNRSTPGMFTEYADVPAATRIAEVSADAVASSGVNLDGYKDAAIVVIGRSGGEGGCGADEHESQSERGYCAREQQRCQPIGSLASIFMVARRGMEDGRDQTAEVGSFQHDRILLSEGETLRWLCASVMRQGRPGAEMAGRRDGPRYACAPGRGQGLLG